MQESSRMDDKTMTTLSAFAFSALQSLASGESPLAAGRWFSTSSPEADKTTNVVCACPMLSPRFRRPTSQSQGICLSRERARKSRKISRMFRPSCRHPAPPQRNFCSTPSAVNSRPALGFQLSARIPPGAPASLDLESPEGASEGGGPESSETAGDGRCLLAL